MAKIRFNSKKILTFFLIVYLSAALLLTLFPRPILLTANPSEIEWFLKTHNDFLSKLLYADPSIIFVGNLLLFTIPVIIFKLRYIWISSRAILIIVFIFSFIIEQLQRLIPGRFSDWLDLLSNIASAFFGLLIVRIYFHLNAAISTK
jgi:glycopeptide antibiotics resistance protein